MKWRRIVPALITLSILVLGFNSILVAINGEFVLAAQLIILAAILDGLDGEVARLFRGVTAFGAKLDTYVDTISFGVAPAVLVYQAMWREVELWGAVVSSAIVVSAAIRFARYNLAQSQVKKHTFTGLPIPVSAIWMAMATLLAESDVLGDGKLAMSHGPLLLLVWTSTLAFLILQVSNVRYAKPTKEMIAWSLGFTLVAMLASGRPAAAFCIGTCAALFAFSFFSPFVLRSQLAGDDEDEEETVAVRHP